MLTLTWDPVDDSRVAVYQVHYGLVSGQYDSIAETASHSATVEDLQPGQTYYFAVRACDSTQLVCSAFSNEITGTPASAPNAGFTVNKTSGYAPLLVSFTDTSSGEITERDWQFGDGGTASDASFVTHTYTVPGTYSIGLSVSGPGGGDTYTLTDAIVVLADDSGGSGGTDLEIIVDNQDANTQQTGTWKASGGADPWEGQSIYSNSGAVFRWLPAIPENGTYLVYAWWTYHDNRSSNVPYRIGHDGGVSTVTVNQHDPASAGQWVLLGEYPFTAGTGYVEVSSENGQASADAVRLVQSGGDNGDDTVADDPTVTDDPHATPPVIEVGEISVSDQWQWVDFQNDFTDPVVVVKPLGSTDSDPAEIRIEIIEKTRFRVRIEEWDYLDGTHVIEKASYLVVERGIHLLDDGTWIEAGSIETGSTGAFASVNFTAPFSEAPVVVSSVTSSNESDTVTVRLRNIGTDSFEILLQEQEANLDVHANEIVDFVAWEPSTGTLDGRPYEVARTADAVRHTPFAITYANPFDSPPAFVADMQSTDSGDTANLRWDQKTATGIKIWVDEETSHDTEVGHTTETVGYMAFGNSGDVSGGTEVEIIVDNQDANTEQTGTWKASGAADPWADQSIYNNGDSVFRWLPAIPQNGTYLVYAWWTHHDNRSSNVPYRIGHDGGVSTVTVNQHDPASAGQWVLLGEYPFTAGTGYVEVSSENGQASADAVRLVRSGDTELEVIVDNQDANTEQTGTWKASGGADPWAGESIYNNSGAVFRWLPAIPENGNFRVYAWWTYHDNRSSNVPYRIGHDGGVSTVTVNQHDPALAGQWVLLGEYPFTAGTGYVEVSSENGQASADAVRLFRPGGNQ